MRRTRAAAIGVLTTGAMLVFVAVALAGLSVKSGSWTIGINDGPDHKVAIGQTFTCSGSGTVGSIGVSVKLRSPIPKGENWGFGLHGPGAAGDAIATNEGPSTGKGTVIQTAEVPVLFPKLKKRNIGSFPSGTYTFVIEVSGRTAYTQKVSLANCPS